MSQTALTSVGNGSGCKCKTLGAAPTYYTFYRDQHGRPVKGMGVGPSGDVVHVGRLADRQQAQRQADKLAAALAVGDGAILRPDGRSFAEWADKYLDEILPANDRRDSTIRAYRYTAKYGKDAFGLTPLRAVGTDDLRRFVDVVRRNAGDATLAKHLRQLSAMFQAAVDEEPPIIRANPVPRFRKKLRLRVPEGTPPYTADELGQLWPRLAGLSPEPVYLAIAKTAVTTGARRGELIGADVDDLSLLEGKLEIRHTYDGESGTLTAPKDHEPRTIYLIPAAVAVLEKWLAVRGSAPGPLFPAPRGGGRLNGDYLLKLVTKARDKAGIPVLGDGGRPRKPFHSLRSSFDALCKQTANPLWIQDQMGHSDARLTLQTYGQWTDATKRAEAAKVPAAGWPV